MDADMYKAVENDRPYELRRILRRGGDPNAWMEDPVRISGKSILHVCCEKGRYKCAEVLLEYGAQADKQGSWGQSPLMVCILTEYLEIGELLLQTSPVNIIDAKDTAGNTSLHKAIENDCVDSVELLLKYRADVNVANNHGITPLMATCAMKTAEHSGDIVKLLLAAGAVVDTKDFRSKRTALHFAVVAKNTETVALLINAGADVSCMDGGGKTPLTNLIWDYVRAYANTETISEDSWTIVKMLIEARTDLDNCSREFSNPIVTAATFKCAPLVQYLLENGASIKLKFFGGMTPLLIAASKNDLATAKILLDWDCDMYVKGRIMRRNYEFFRDPFELAIELGYCDFACLLAGFGYNLSQVGYLVNWEIDPPEVLQRRLEVLEYLRLNAVLPPTLFRCTVLCIRKCLSRGISARTLLLPLPKVLMDCIRLKDILDDS